jgi:NAD(P)-dependent dehydrogenase (short-subunit alcohol dehydrogenase family)
MMPVTKTVLITGASRGLGKSLAIAFGGLNYNVMLCARNESLLQKICGDIIRDGGNASYLTCDVEKLEDVQKAIEHTVTTFGQIDIAIFNAGTSGSVRFSDFNRPLFDSILATNLTGTVNCLSAIIPTMQQQGFGTIVGISSLADSRPIPGNSPYVASKAALTILLEAAAMELKPLGIDVVTVRPGFISTDMTASNTMPMPLLMSADRAAMIIVKGILKKRANISFPFPAAIGSALLRFIPVFVWRYIFRIRQ